MEQIRYSAAACQTDMPNPIDRRQMRANTDRMLSMVDSAVAGSAAFLPVRVTKLRLKPPSQNLPGSYANRRYLSWWTIINRARAIENIAYVVAANQGASLRHYPPYSWPGGSQVVDSRVVSSRTPRPDPASESSSPPWTCRRCGTNGRAGVDTTC